MTAVVVVAAAGCAVFLDGSLNGVSRPSGLWIAPGQSEQVRVSATSLGCCRWEQGSG